MFVLEVSCSNVYVCPWRVSKTSAFSCLHDSLTKRASHLHPSTSRINSSTRSLEFSDLTFFCSTMKVTSFSCSFSRSASFSSMLLPLESLPSLPAFFSLHFCCCLFPFALLLLLLPFSFILGSDSLASSLLRMHSGTSPSTCRNTCLPPPFPFTFSLFFISVPHSSSFFSCTMERHRQHA